METEKYSLREIKEEDFNEIFSIYSDKEVCRYFGINILKNKSDAVKMVASRKHI